MFVAKEEAKEKEKEGERDKPRDRERNTKRERERGEDTFQPMFTLIQKQMYGRNEIIHIYPRKQKTNKQQV